MHKEWLASQVAQKPVNIHVHACTVKPIKARVMKGIHTLVLFGGGGRAGGVGFGVAGGSVVFGVISTELLALKSKVTSTDIFLRSVQGGDMAPSSPTLPMVIFFLVTEISFSSGKACSGLSLGVVLVFLGGGLTSESRFPSSSTSLCRSGFGGGSLIISSLFSIPFRFKFIFVLSVRSFSLPPSPAAGCLLAKVTTSSLEPLPALAISSPPFFAPSFNFASETSSFLGERSAARTLKAATSSGFSFLFVFASGSFLSFFASGSFWSFCASTSSISLLLLDFFFSGSTKPVSLSAAIRLSASSCQSGLDPELFSRTLPADFRRSFFSTVTLFDSLSLTWVKGGGCEVSGVEAFGVDVDKFFMLKTSAADLERSLLAAASTDSLLASSVVSICVPWDLFVAVMRESARFFFHCGTWSVDLPFWCSSKLDKTEVLALLGSSCLLLPVFNVTVTVSPSFLSGTFTLALVSWSLGEILLFPSELELLPGTSAEPCFCEERPDFPVISLIRTSLGDTMSFLLFVPAADPVASLWSVSLDCKRLTLLVTNRDEDAPFESDEGMLNLLWVWSALLEDVAVWGEAEVMVVEEAVEEDVSRTWASDLRRPVRAVASCWSFALLTDVSTSMGSLPPCLLAGKLTVDFEVNVEETLLPPPVDVLLLFEALVIVTNGGGLGEEILLVALLSFELETDVGGGGLAGGVSLSLWPDDDAAEPLLLDDDRMELTAGDAPWSLADLVDDVAAESPTEGTLGTCCLGDLLLGSDDFFGKSASLDLLCIAVSRLDGAVEVGGCRGEGVGERERDTGAESGSGGGADDGRGGGDEGSGDRFLPGDFGLSRAFRNASGDLALFGTDVWLPSMLNRLLLGAGVGTCAGLSRTCTDSDVSILSSNTFLPAATCRGLATGPVIFSSTLLSDADFAQLSALLPASAELLGWFSGLFPESWIPDLLSNLFAEREEGWDLPSSLFFENIDVFPSASVAAWKTSGSCRLGDVTSLAPFSADKKSLLCFSYARASNLGVGDNFLSFCAASNVSGLVGIWRSDGRCLSFKPRSPLLKPESLVSDLFWSVAGLPPALFVSENKNFCTSDFLLLVSFLESSDGLLRPCLSSTTYVLRTSDALSNDAMEDVDFEVGVLSPSFPCREGERNGERV